MFKRGFIVGIAVLVVAVAGLIWAFQPKPLRPAPPFALKDLAGHAVSVAGLKGKVVVLDFWATWCQPCLVEIPHFIDLQNKYKDKDVVIIGMSLDSLQPADIAKFAKTNGMNYPIVMTDETTATAYGADEGLPITYILNRNGDVVSRHQGLTDKDTFELDIRKALKE